jgi:CBS domain-containing protein
MTTAGQLLLQKGGQVWTVTPHTSLRDTLELMAEKDIGVVVVMEGTRVAGIFSERDFAREAVKNREISLETPISKLMTRLVYFVRPEQTMEECMALMTEKHIRHLPVLVDDHVIGLISIGDVVKEVLSYKDTTIRSLENYILGREYSL